MAQVYKVVLNVENRLVSVGKLKVEYRPEYWTEASIGGLLAFDNLVSARRFALRSLRYTWPGQIWLADADEQVSLPSTALACPDEYFARLLWEGKFTGGLQWPEGTVAFRKLRLVRRID
jgi:hypothetical protein